MAPGRIFLLSSSWLGVPLTAMLIFLVPPRALLSNLHAALAHLQCGGKLQRSLEGPAHEVFARVLRGLSGKKLTKPGSFRSADGNGSAVKCSYKVSRQCPGRLTASMCPPAY